MTTIRQVQIYTTPIYDKDGGIIGELRFNPFDTFSLDSFRNLAAVCMVVFERLANLTGETLPQPDEADIDAQIEAKKAQIREYKSRAEMYAEMKQLFDETFGDGNTDLLFCGTIDITTLLEVYDWATQYVDTDSNPEFATLKDRFAKLKMAQKNRAERRAKK